MISWVIKNTNDKKFMVVHRECGSDSLWSIHNDFESAYKTAKAMGFGKEPINEAN